MKKSQLKYLVQECVQMILEADGRYAQDAGAGEFDPQKFAVNEKVTDPSRDEMIEYLRSQFGNEEGFEYDAEEALYWFANLNHGGQSSNLYSVLSTSQFQPGPISRGPETGSAAEMMLNSLETEFGADHKPAEEEGGEEEAMQEDGGAAGGPGGGGGISVTANASMPAVPGAFKRKKSMEEEEQPEPYDDTTDQFAPGPRSRTEPSEGNPDKKLLKWAIERYQREGNPNNLMALKRVILLLKKDLGL